MASRDRLFPSRARKEAVSADGWWRVISHDDLAEAAMRYTVILERELSGIIVAHVPALRDCTSQGRTKREVMRNIREAISLDVETLIEHN